MISQISKEKPLYSNIGATHLKKLKLSINEWLMLMSSESVFADELMIFALSCTFQRHSVIFTHNACWTSIGTDQPITGNRLLEICQVHLIYIGVHMYAELKRRPFILITSTAITDPSSSLPPSTGTTENTTTVNCAIDLSMKHAETSSLETDSNKHLESVKKGNLPSNIEVLELTSDTPSEDLLTG